MKWKTNTKFRNNSSEEEQQQSEMVGKILPYLLADSTETQQQTSCGIRVVDNKIFFYGDIDQQSCLELNRLLMEVDIKNQNLKNTLSDHAYTPIIHLHMNTHGGCIYSAFSTVDTIRTLKSSVHTYVDGLVASAGTLISSVGHKRIMGKYAQMLVHQLSSETCGTYMQMQNDMDNCENLMKILKQFYKTHTKIPMKRLDELMKADIYLDATECLTYSLIDQII